MKLKLWLGVLAGGLVVIALLGTVSAAWAASPAAIYDLSWNVIAGGGATQTAGGLYTVGGTVGQAATGPLNGTGYALNAGFWLPGTYSGYLPQVLRGG